MYKNMRGVSLMELMIVIVIVGILASIAYPSYREYLARSKRTEAKAALLQIATNQEREYLNTNSYTTDMTALGFGADPFVTDSGSYSVAVTAADGNGYSATATYQKADDEAGKCSSFTIDDRGARTSAPYDDCWTRTR